MGGICVPYFPYGGRFEKCVPIGCLYNGASRGGLEDTDVIRLICNSGE